jgi:[citrate (pro-3S)-lyase] ligase
MAEYTVEQILPYQRAPNHAVDLLLTESGIRREQILDYTCGIFDTDRQLLATGSCAGNTLRCFAVHSAYRGEGLLNSILTHLITVEHQRGITHLFLYTKPETARFFRESGFYEIASVPDLVVFMENRRTGFSEYLAALSSERAASGTSCAIVMNANPFTRGHQYLVEKAASEAQTVHLFIVSEDRSFFPADVRRRLIREGTRHLKNVILHDCGPYLISSATFPAYFQKDTAAVIESQARLDVAIFIKIAHSLGITARYAGEEPYSLVTGIYNTIMTEMLSAAGIAFHVIPRLNAAGKPISASTVRQCIQHDDMALLQQLVPPATLAYLTGSEADGVRAAIRGSADVVHY